MIDPNIIVTIHDRMIAEFGGLPGTPDLGKLLGAIGRMESLLDYEFEGGDIFDAAAIVLVAIARSHAFNDANKRTAFACALYFLFSKGILIRNDEKAEELHQLMTVDAAAGAIKREDVAGHLRHFAV